MASHCETSLGSCDEYRLSAKRPLTLRSVTVAWLIKPLPHGVGGGFKRLRYLMCLSVFLFACHLSRICVRKLANQSIPWQSITGCSIMTSSQIQDGGLPLIWKSLRRHISVRCENFQNFEIQDGGRSPSFIATFSEISDFDEIFYF